MENAGDLESLTGWIRRNCLEDISQAQTWAGVHAVLDRYGLTLRERGNGLVISSGDVHVKGSSVDRRLSKKRLEERLGPFVAKTGKLATPEKVYVKKPMGKKHEHLWNQYNHWSASNDAERKAALLHARQERDAALKEVRHSGDLKYAVIKYAVSDPAMRRFLMRLNRMRLRRKAQKLREAYALQRQNVFRRFRHVTWSAWLTREAAANNSEALAYLHARKQAATHTGGLTGLRGMEGSRPAVQKVTRHGTFIYADGKERKQRILVDGHASDADLAKSLELAKRLFGSRLVVEGPSEFMSRIARFAGTTKMPVSFVNGHIEAQRQAALLGRKAELSRSRGR